MKLKKKILQVFFEKKRKLPGNSSNHVFVYNFLTRGFNLCLVTV